MIVYITLFLHVYDSFLNYGFGFTQIYIIVRHLYISTG